MPNRWTIIIRHYNGYVLKMETSLAIIGPLFVVALPWLFYFYLSNSGGFRTTTRVDQCGGTTSGFQGDDMLGWKMEFGWLVFHDFWCSKGYVKTYIYICIYVYMLVTKMHAYLVLNPFYTILASFFIWVGSTWILVDMAPHLNLVNVFFRCLQILVVY